MLLGDARVDSRKSPLGAENSQPCSRCDGDDATVGGGSFTRLARQEGQDPGGSTRRDGGCRRCLRELPPDGVTYYPGVAADGDGTFSEGATESGVHSYGWYTGIAASDVNEDRWTDLFVADYDRNGMADIFVTKFGDQTHSAYTNDGGATPSCSRMRSAGSVSIRWASGQPDGAPLGQTSTSTETSTSSWRTGTC